MRKKQPSNGRDLIDPDDAPDHSTAEWKEKFDKVPVQRAQPRANPPKIATTAETPK